MISWLEPDRPVMVNPGRFRFLRGVIQFSARAGRAEGGAERRRTGSLSSTLFSAFRFFPADNNRADVVYSPRSSTILLAPHLPLRPPRAVQKIMAGRIKM